MRDLNGICQQSQQNLDCGWLLQPTPLTEVPHRHQRRCHHQRQRKRVAPGLRELWHVLEVHAVDAGDQRGRQQGHAGHREDLDDLVLVDVDEADGGVHQIGRAHV